MQRSSCHDDKENKKGYSQTWARAILGVGLNHSVDITHQNSDDQISYATSKAQTKTERSNISQKIEQMRNQVERPCQCEKYHKQDCQKSQELMS
jgi:uncharacterized lipoprotein YehR (DUF1307 family)